MNGFFHFPRYKYNKGRESLSFKDEQVAIPPKYNEYTNFTLALNQSFLGIKSYYVESKI